MTPVWKLYEDHNDVCNVYSSHEVLQEWMFAAHFGYCY